MINKIGGVFIMILSVVVSIFGSQEPATNAQVLAGIVLIAGLITINSEK